MPNALSPGRFSRAEHKEIGAAILAAIAPLETEFRVKFKSAGGTYGPSAIIKIEAARINEDGEAETAERVAFRKLAHLYGLSPDDLDRTFTQRRDTFRIIGLNANARRNVIIAVNIKTEKEFVFPAGIVKLQLSRP